MKEKNGSNLNFRIRAFTWGLENDKMITYKYIYIYIYIYR